MENFLNKLAEILEVDKVDKGDTISTFEEWDSLTTLSIIATVDADFKVTLSAEELASLTTIGDLTALINSKIVK